MSTSNEKRLDDQNRLLEIREYLGVKAKPNDHAFAAQVVDACLLKVRPIIELNSNATGEVIVGEIAKYLGVHFEEVKTTADIVSIEQKYLVGQKEIGFGRLADELADPTVDAVLFQRLHAAPDASDRWVAVLNLQKSQARAYWSRPHEVIHRLAEPPQRRLPFFRHREDHKNRIERLIDLGAGELAFPPSIYGALVNRVAHRQLTWDLVETVRRNFAPTSSLQAATKAFLRHWPQPAFFVSATVRGRRGKPEEGVALRMDLVGFSPNAERSDIQFFTNMRVSQKSPIWHTHETGRSITDYENLIEWSTSSGDRLPGHRVLTSGLRRGPMVYGLISLA